jgi:hypothetical protein
MTIDKSFLTGIIFDGIHFNRIHFNGIHFRWKAFQTHMLLMWSTGHFRGTTMDDLG